MIYQILHNEIPLAQIDTQGSCRILSNKFMPFNLYLEETDDPTNNLSNFYFWCANRIIPSNRQYADIILKSLSMTSKEPAQIALQCHCLSLTDVYWVRTSNESITFKEINLYDNYSENLLIDASLLGKQVTLQSLKGIEKDLSTDGCFPKAWIGNKLLKGGNPIAVNDIYAVNHDIDPIEYILSLDAYSYYMMNILDYLIGNTDRHWGNWGFLIDNQTNTPISLHPLMDFNQAFTAYDSIEGANCLTTSTQMTQKEAAIEAVKQIGLNQISSINPDWFQHDQPKYEMFLTRLSILKEVIQQ